MHFGLRMYLEDVAQRSALVCLAIISLLHLSQINHLPQNLCTAPHQDRTLAIYPSTNHHQRYVHLYFTSIAYNSPGMFWFLCFFSSSLLLLLTYHPCWITIHTLHTNPPSSFFHIFDSCHSFTIFTLCFTAFLSHICSSLTHLIFVATFLFYRTLVLHAKWSRNQRSQPKVVLKNLDI